MMTPTIAIDAVYRNADPASERKYLGLGFVDFEFFPHAVVGTSQFAKIVEYSRSSGTLVLGCPDGSGIVINGTVVALVGRGYRISNGVAADWQPS